MQRPHRPAARLLGLSLAIACIGLSTRTTHAQDTPTAPDQPAAAPAPEQPAAAPAPPAQPDIAALLQHPNLDPVQRMQLEVLQLLNQRRAEAGLGPLLLDQRLVAAAAEHSQDMATRRFCRHGGSDGSTARARMVKHGYPANNWTGENIICSRKSAETAMAWWMRSRPHRKNILHRHYSHLGIGVDPNGPYGPMWTLNFAAGADDTAQPTTFDVANTTGEAGSPAEQAAGEGG